LPSAFVKERTNKLIKGSFLLGSLECAKSKAKVQDYFLGSALDVKCSLHAAVHAFDK